MTTIGNGKIPGLDEEKAIIPPASALAHLPQAENIHGAHESEKDWATAPVPDANDQDSTLPLSKGRTIALVVTLTGAAVLNTLSVQASVIILPTIGRDLDIPNAAEQWIVSSYSLAFGTFLLLWGRLADVYGKRSIFILGSAWVCLTTLVCPFVPNAIGFNVFRGLQGLGAAANVPTAIGILGVTFPPGKAKNYAFAAYSSGAPVSLVIKTVLLEVFIARIPMFTTEADVG